VTRKREWVDGVGEAKEIMYRTCVSELQLGTRDQADRGEHVMLPDRKQWLRETGLPVVGDVPWGSHFCIFYKTKKDLRDILVPFFKAGLEANEFCLSYIGSHEFLTVKHAENAFRKELPDFERQSKNGNIEIVTRKKWFGANGMLDLSKATCRLQKNLDRALARGLKGLRFHGSSAWLRARLPEGAFCEYEEKLNSMLAGQPMIIACTFPLTLTGAEQILDAAHTHQFAVTVRNGIWKRVEIADIAAAKKEARNIDPKLEQLTFRQREILQLVAKGQNTKQIAGLLGISVKTVEAHRLQLMRRLKIDNVPGLVRFAIRTGLVSAEA
jgi:DNA-binding CsgD family transcriptional regulator